MVANFNSIKVQLELGISVRALVKIVSFQFHKGTIRTTELQEISSIIFLFQFHKGTIRTLRCKSFTADVVFQFHKGTIRT